MDRPSSNDGAGDDWTAEVAEIAAEARALLEWEQELGGVGVPPVQVPELEAAAAGTEPAAASAPDTASADGDDSQRALFESPKPAERPKPPRPRRGTAGGPPTGPSQLPGLPPQERDERLRVLQEEAATCTKCALHKGRTKSVFARGSGTAELVFIGEGPGYHEDQQGAPFVGNAGQLLDKMIAAMGFAPDEVYICNVVKCRPPENRTPLPDEAGACLPYLEGQLEAIGPKVIVALGRTAAQHLGCIDENTRGWRGRWRAYKSVPVMPTYHPAFLLRSPNMKRPVWEDLQQVMRHLGKEPPQKKR